MKYSEALLVVCEMLDGARERAGFKAGESYAFDSGVLMSALATVMTSNPDVVDYVKGSK